MFGSLINSLQSSGGSDFLGNAAQQFLGGNTEGGSRDEGGLAGIAGGLVSSFLGDGGSSRAEQPALTAFESPCNGNKKALFIGINYFGMQGELRGCLNDVENIRSFVTQRFGFPMENVHVLTDDQQDPDHIPTKANILRECQWLVSDAQPGDSLFFHYSGHGGKSAGGEDEVDKQDETIVPLDYEQAGQITDNELHQVLVEPLPAGVRLTCIFDSCHSGTVVDLPYTYRCDGKIDVIVDDAKKEAFMHAINAGQTFLRGDKQGALSGFQNAFQVFTRPAPNRDAQDKLERENRSDADVIQFAGCHDAQTSADAQIEGKATGAMSHAFIKAFEELGEGVTYTRLLEKIRDILKGQYSQIPQMSAGRPLNLETAFIM